MNEVIILIFTVSLVSCVSSCCLISLFLMLLFMLHSYFFCQGFLFFISFYIHVKWLTQWYATYSMRLDSNEESCKQWRKSPRTKPDSRLEQSTWDYNIVLICSCLALGAKIEPIEETKSRPRCRKKAWEFYRQIHMKSSGSCLLLLCSEKQDTACVFVNEKDTIPE